MANVARREQLVQRAQAEAERRLETTIREQEALRGLRADVAAAHAELTAALARLDSL